MSKTLIKPVENEDFWGTRNSKSDLGSRPIPGPAVVSIKPPPHLQTRFLRKVTFWDFQNGWMGGVFPSPVMPNQIHLECKQIYLNASRFIWTRVDLSERGNIYLNASGFIRTRTELSERTLNWEILVTENHQILKFWKSTKWFSTTKFPTTRISNHRNFQPPKFPSSNFPILWFPPNA